MREAVTFGENEKSPRINKKVSNTAYKAVFETARGWNSIYSLILSCFFEFNPLFFYTRFREYRDISRPDTSHGRGLHRLKPS